MTVRRFTIALLALVSTSVPAQTASAATPASAAERLGGGLSVSWFETRSGPARFSSATTAAVAGAGFGHLRIRVRADRFRSAADFRRLARVVDVTRRSGLHVVVSWSLPVAQARPTAARRAAYVRWWSAAARALRSQPDTVLLGLLDDPGAARGLGRTATHRDWTARALRAIRATGGRNRTRVVVVPALTADPASLSQVLRRDRRVLPSWHRYPSGPTRRRGATQWVGDGSVRGRALVDRAVAVAARHRPTYLAAWSPLDRARGTLNATEAGLFGRHLRSRLRAAGIPWTITRLEDFYDERAQRWRVSARIGGSDVPAGAILAAASGLTLPGIPSAGAGGGPGVPQTTPTPTPTPTASPSPAPSPEPTASPGPSTPLVVAGVELAQTHVLPPEGKSWGAPLVAGARRELHFTGGRETLALVRFGSATPSPVAPRLEGTLAGQVLGTVALAPPADLPRTEASGAPYATDRYSARIPAAWMQPGLRLRVIAESHTASAETIPKIGASPAFSVRVLPFYLFGATPQNSGKPLAQTGAPSAATRASMFGTWPVSSLDASNHPAQAAVWPELVVGPRGGRAAYVARNTDEFGNGKDKFEGMSGALSVLGRLRAANGDDTLTTQYYGPLIWRTAAGQVTGSGGGLGGGSNGVGDDSYAGIFIHEQGHAFGLPHVGAAWADQEYPYRGGSLQGSAWGYDISKDVLRSTFVPSTASSYAGCADDTFNDGDPRVVVDGRCVKQDPMQSGSGDQDAGEPFTMFSDYSMAVMQDWFENDDRAEVDPSSSTGYRRWNPEEQRYEEAPRTTTSNGLYGFLGGLPTDRDVPVYGIAFTRSNANTPGTTKIYPPLSFTGNLVKTIDPTSQADIDLVGPGGPGRWYCEYYGCDVTLKVTYANGQVRHVLRNDGFRSWFGADDPQPASATDPTDSDSFRTYAVNVPRLGSTIARIDLLSTPVGYQQVLTGSPPVLATWTP